MGIMNELSVFEEKFVEKKCCGIFMYENYLGFLCMMFVVFELKLLVKQLNNKKNCLKMVYSVYVFNDQFCLENNQLVVDGLQYNFRVGFMLQML